MRSRLLAGLFVCAACGAAQVKPAPRPKPKPAGLTAARIIEKSIAATGGRAAIQKLTSTYAKGSMEFPASEMHGTMELYAKAPNKQLIVTNLETVGEVRQGFDGEVAWTQDPSGIITELSGAPLEDFKRSAVFNAPLRWRDLYPKAVLLGSEVIAGRKAHVIQLTTAAGQAVTRYYDAETFLLLREKGKRQTPQGTLEISADFSDYRDVDGIKAPFLIKQMLPVGQVLLIVREMRNNIEIDDATFSKPAAH